MTPEEILLAKELAHRFAEISGIEIQDKKAFPPALLKEHPELEQALELFEELYQDFPLAVTKKTSRWERDSQGLTSPTLVYGEIHFAPFAQQLLKIKTQYGGLAEPGGTFVDVGCGAGRPVFAAALLHDFDRCIGIEILEGLHEVCGKVEAVWRDKILPKLPLQKQQVNIEWWHTDATKANWKDAALVFANSTCFSPELMEKIALKADSMREGSFFISTTRKLPSPYFEILEQAKMSESWGAATCFIHRRLPDE